MCGQAQRPHICGESDTPEIQPADMKGRSGSGQTKTPRNPSAGSEARGGRRQRREDLTSCVLICRAVGRAFIIPQPGRGVMFRTGSWKGR